MLKRSSRFKTIFVSLVVIVSSMALMGCPKKVSPVAGSEGIAQEGIAQGDQSSSQGSGSGRASSQSGSDNSMASKGSGGSSGENNMASSGSGSGMSMSGASASFSTNVYFDFDVWKIRSDAKDVLTENARWLMSNTSAKIQIEGHGDERGTSEYNLVLGERRARSTKRYLSNLGVSPSRISFISFGEEKNICSEKSENCFQKNRRAHFIVK